MYSLGAILYHLLTGRPPFQGDTIQDVLLQLRQTEPIPPRRLNPSIPEDLQTICLRCLEKEPVRRFATAREFSAELGRHLRGEPILSRPLNRPENLWRWCRRRPGVASLSAGTAILLLASLAGSWLAAWRIDLARRAENAEREKSLQANAGLERANTRLAETVTFLEPATR